MSSRLNDTLIRIIKTRSSEGENHDIYEIQEWRGFADRPIKGYKRCQLGNGDAVNVIGDGKYELITIGVITVEIKA